MPKALQFPSLVDDAVQESRVPACDAPEPGIPVDSSDLARNVYGLLGLPLDALDFPNLLRLVEGAVASAAPFLVSTPNVNFLITSQSDGEFRESILQSDLCLVDGMPLIWLAKLLNIPVKERIAGSDLFGRLKSAARRSPPMKIFLLGGADGTAETVRDKLNSEDCGLQCVGALNPGFGTIEEMSSKPIMDAINASEADLLGVFFGAQKAQAWLMRNHRNLRVPVRAQFGATINFEAGTIKRAPHLIRSTGFEWLWRIKEEPYLWRRYWKDGRALIKLLFTSALPLAVEAWLQRRKPSGLSVKLRDDALRAVIELRGDAVAQNIDQAIGIFGSGLERRTNILLDLSEVRSIDARMFGLLLMLRKSLMKNGLKLSVEGASPELRRAFRLNRFEFLLSGTRDTDTMHGVADWRPTAIGVE